LTAPYVILAMASAIATASQGNECGAECTVTGTCTGTDDGGGELETKGNAGWGNGPDSTKAESFSGKAAVTKLVNGLCVDKFDGRYDGR
jgi:hypothetical protein